eukprot:gnl/TRDRNA2_/TRDRNA2_195506_c0_seq1.p1 gnl/TRDRNA2_/TRDRNA2_195506_c0~~gnl/TRDRNA2_/TRDRNA2_195506_c0_seq1.p1  ORF type:complete len:262 (-),score=34.71 gnl/TRDRNA2_/TRDRNA2_195506_c0_seq1:45-830(-)
MYQELDFTDAQDYSVMRFSRYRTTLVGTSVEFWATAERKDLLVECDMVGEEEMSLPADQFVPPRNDDFTENIRCGIVFDSVPLLCDRLATWLGKRQGNWSISAWLGNRQPPARILELGAGMGLPGMWAALHGATVVLSDGHLGVVKLLQESVKANNLGTAAVEVRRLVWGAPFSPWASGDCTFDLVIAADVIYYDDAVQPLFETARAALHSGATFLLGHKDRGLVALSRVLQGAESAGLKLVGTTTCRHNQLVSVFEFEPV